MKTHLRMAVVSVAVLVGILLFTSKGYAGSGGKDIFLANKCTNCHSVTAQHVAKGGDSETKAVDLSKVGAERNAQWMTGWLHGTETLKGKKHRKIWKGSDADLATLVGWLAGLK